MKVQMLFPLLFGGVLLAVSALVNWVMLRRVRILDIPGDRSSHEAPTPSSGGLGIVLSFLLASVTIHLLGDSARMSAGHFPGFIVSALLVAGISLYDDIAPQPFHTKLVAQLVAVLMVLASDIVIRALYFPGLGHIELAWGGYALTAIWILGLANAFNFMDGLDGLAGGTAVIVAVYFAVINSGQGNVFVTIISTSLAAGSLGFLLFNFPPARIFMGDVGSAFLGFVLATLAVVAAQDTQTPTPLLVMPMLLFNFIYDTLFTLWRRWRAGEAVIAAHKGHLYQLANQLGYSHRAVSLFHYGVAAAQGAGAVLLLQLDEALQPLAFLPFLVFQLLYSRAIIRRSREAGIVS